MEKSTNYSAIGSHQAVFDLVDINRMTTLDSTGFIRYPQIARIFDDSMVGSFFGNGKRITKMTWRTAQHFGIMSLIEFFVLVAGKAHINGA